MTPPQTPKPLTEDGLGDKFDDDGKHMHDCSVCDGYWTCEAGKCPDPKEKVCLNCRYDNAIAELKRLRAGPSELDKSFMKNTKREEYPNKTFEECKSSLELMTIKFYWMRDKLWHIWGMDENKES